MAFRASSLRFRTLYDDFQPKFEAADTPQAHILKIHLPGFVIEQVRIRYAGASMLNVSGERPITGINKWSRFRQAHPVPEGCNVKRLKAKFEQEILTITMPKRSISQAAASQGEAKTSQEKAPSPSMEAVAETKTEKAQVGTPAKSTLEQRDKKRVSSDELKPLSPSMEAVAEPKTKKTQVGTPAKSALEQTDKRRVSSDDMKPPSPPKEAVAEPKSEKKQVETTLSKSEPPPVEEQSDKSSVSFAYLKAPSPSKAAVAEPKSEKEQVETPPKSTPPSVEEPSDKRSVSFPDLKASSPSKETVTEPKTDKAQVETPPKSAPTFVEEPRDEKRDSSADLKAPSPSEEAVAEPKTEKAQVDNPPESTPPYAEETRDKRSVSFADLKAPSTTQEAVAEPKTEKAQVETPRESTPPSVEEPKGKRSVHFADQKAPKDQEDNNTAQKPLPDIEKPADDNQSSSLTTPEPNKEVIKPQAVQGEILQKPTETTADPILQTGGVVQKGEEFEPKPTLPMASTKETDENTQKCAGEFFPKTTLTTAPLDLKKHTEDKLQKALEDIMQKPGLRTVPKMKTDENIAGRRAEDPEKEISEKIAKLFEPRMPEKGMTAKPHPISPEKEKGATGGSATIYKEKHTEDIIDTIWRGIKEVAASTSYNVTNIAEHKLKDEEKNLLSMVMAALAAHVSYRSTSSGKP